MIRMYCYSIINNSTYGNYKSPVFEYRSDDGFSLTVFARALINLYAVVTTGIRLQRSKARSQIPAATFLIHLSYLPLYESPKPF